MCAIPERALRRFVQASHRVGTEGLVRCSSGNLSCRLDEERMLITASRSWLGELTCAKVALCRIADGASLNAVKPSAEIGFHAGILQSRREIKVVLHFQTPHATALACRRGETLDFSIIPEIPFYVGPIGTVPYLHPGSSELAEAVVSAALRHDLLLLRNHGQVVVGKDFDDAIQRAVFFELACEIIGKSGFSAEAISQEQVAYLRELGREEHGRRR